MKKIYTTTCLISFLLMISISSAQAKNLKAYLGMSQFAAPGKGSFIETYLNLAAKSIVFATNQNGKYQASVAVNITFSKGDSILAYQKYNLLSLEYNDTLTARANFIDVQRFYLPKGEYTFDLLIADNNNINKPFKYNQLVTIETDITQTSFSNIQLIDNYKKSETPNSLTKSGYDFVPYVSSYFPESVKEINFYTELYSLDKLIPVGETFVINTYLESFENNVMMTNFFRATRSKSAAVIPVLSAFDLSKLPSGNYNLVVEARNKENLIVADQKTFIQRNNPKVEPNLEELSAININNTFVNKIEQDSLREFIKWLKPKSSRIEVEYAENLLEAKDLHNMQQFFYSFWQKRNSVAPEKDWKIYKEDVYWVNKNFSSITRSRKGYCTERGRVYLQYGKPDSRIVFDRETDSYPYEIWQYYKVNNRSNRRFIFYNPDLVTNDYRLLHSDAIGEVKEPRWQMKLKSRTVYQPNFDVEKTGDQYGNNFKDAYDISR